jgi:hypothetical protein
MKKIVLPVSILFAGIFVFQACKNDPAGEPQAPQSESQAIGIKKNSDAFNQSFEQLLNSYYALKDALVESDVAKADAASLKLAEAAGALKVDEIKGDSTGVIKETARSFTGTIDGSAKGLAGEKDIEAKRKEFEMITDAMWSLTRTVQYAGEKVYYQHCPMAFNNKGAYWLSDKREIRNPYFGDKMLTCGSNEDSLDYSKQ